MNEDAKIPSNEKLQGKNCFVCGRDNPKGLNIPFYHDGEYVSATFTPSDALCGFEKIVHGGIIFSIADEAMMHLIWAKKLRAITAEVTIRFHNYSRTGDQLTVKAQLEEVTSHLIKAQSIVTGAGGKKIARAQGKFLPFSEGEYDNFQKQF